MPSPGPTICDLWPCGMNMAASKVTGWIRGGYLLKKCKTVLRTGGCYEWIDGSVGVQYHPLELVLHAASLEEGCEDGIYEFGRFLSNRADCISQGSTASSRIIRPKILKHNS